MAKFVLTEGTSSVLTLYDELRKRFTMSAAGCLVVAGTLLKVLRSNTWQKRVFPSIFLGLAILYGGLAFFFHLIILSEDEEIHEPSFR